MTKPKRHNSDVSSSSRGSTQSRNAGAQRVLQMFQQILGTSGRGRTRPARRQSKKKSEGSMRLESIPSVSSDIGMLGSAVNQAGPSDQPQVLECPVCLVEMGAEEFTSLCTCSHRTCNACLQHYLLLEIVEGRVSLRCPACPTELHPSDIYANLTGHPEVIRKYEEFSVRRALSLDPDTRWCPSPDCPYAVIASGCANCPQLRCERPGCGTQFCYHCRAYWHPNQSCDAAREVRQSRNRFRRDGLRSAAGGSDSLAKSEDMKKCPRCIAMIVKMDDGSCNHMTCAVCSAEFCWLCMKEISDLHYLSPSGCTFWGKKPWSRKKKIMCQLATLIGAPIGVALVGAVAVPAIIIAMPVYVGQRIYHRHKRMKKHRRNALVAAGVAGAIISGPVLAAAFVGIGIPIFLAYIYGVVPVSLCRSGGCGVSATDGGGVRFELDDEVVATHGGLETQSIAAGNASIAPSIGEVSMTFAHRLSASGSHMERVGQGDADTDRESTSHQAAAGSLVESASTHANRLEVHADVSHPPRRRHSLSSESANFSATVSFISETKSETKSERDDASTRVLVGSLYNQTVRDTSSIAEVNPDHGDARSDTRSDTRSDRFSVKSSDARSGILRGEGDVREGGRENIARDASPISTSRVTFDVTVDKPYRRAQRTKLAHEHGRPRTPEVAAVMTSSSSSSSSARSHSMSETDVAHRRDVQRSASLGGGARPAPTTTEL